MVEWWWGYVIMLYPLAMAYLAGNKQRAAWVVALWGIVVWNLYGWTTRQDGFIVINGFFLVNYLSNWFKWRRD